MREVFVTIVLAAASMLAAHAQRQVAPAVTDANDPKFITAQTRKMGGPMPPEQLALIFDHLDLAMKVFPDRQRIEATATLRLTTKSRIDTLILDLFPKFTIAEIDLDGARLPATAYANPEGQLRITLPAPFDAGRTFDARVVYAGTPPVAKRPPWEGGTTWTKTPDGTKPWIDTSLWGGGCDMLYPCLDHPTLKPATSDLHYTVPPD
jgi:aminopeptidase N